MNHQQMWEAYCKTAKPDGGYSAWAFGEKADTLAQLVLAGIKTGTASLQLWYEDEKEHFPAAGEYSIVLDSREKAVCIIRTTKVYTVPFSGVNAEHAFREGEGDRSLAYWRRVHERFFSEELKKEGLAFDPQMLVVCEEFEKVYP